MIADEYDVVVVGGGGAGLASAVSAAEHGASVLLLEKMPRLGGSTGRAVGSFTSSGTSFQRRAGIVDDPDAHQADAGLFGPRDYEQRNNAELRRYFFGESAATLDWLRGMGLAFHGPSPEPPNRVPRMHNVVPNAKAYVATLQLRLLRLGGTIACDAPVVDLVLDDGRVTGVSARIEGRPRTITARRGVVLAAGDYTNSSPMISKYRGERFAVVEGINPDALGEGHLLAERAGAALVNMDITYGPELRFLPPQGATLEQLLPSRGPLLRLMTLVLPFVPGAVMRWMIKRLVVTWQHPDDTLLADGAILVNGDGRRFCDEGISPDREIAVAGQPGKQAFMLLDEPLVERYSAWPHYVSTAPEIAYAYVADYLRLRPDIAAQGASLAELARARQMPVGALEETVAGYRAAFADPSSSDVPRTGGRPLGGSRWVMLGPLRAYFTNTEGGAAIDRDLRVLDGSGRPIPGLYAAGQTGLGGMVLWGHGLHIAWALTSGRLVGEGLGRGIPGHSGTSAARRSREPGRVGP
jgi:succinate dehydrogenase/fumarate reductase flavoprotein subunit